MYVSAKSPNSNTRIFIHRKKTDMEKYKNV